MRKENTPNHYLVVRVEVIEVKKTMFGLRDVKKIGFNNVITNSQKETKELFDKINALIKQESIKNKWIGLDI